MTVISYFGKNLTENMKTLLTSQISVQEWDLNLIHELYCVVYKCLITFLWLQVPNDDDFVKAKHVVLYWQLSKSESYFLVSVPSLYVPTISPTPLAESTLLKLPITTL